MDSTTKELISRFRKERLKKKLTQEQVAKKANINVNYYAVIERGEVNTSADKLTKIADALGIKLLP